MGLVCTVIRRFWGSRVIEKGSGRCCWGVGIGLLSEGCPFFIRPDMIYSLDLKTAFFVLGGVLLGGGVLIGAGGGFAARWMEGFPRSKGWGAAILGVVALWAWLLISKIDLGEFSGWRTRLLVIIPVMAVLSLFFVEEFLAVRALGMLVLLGAKPLLEAAWMQPEQSRLALVSVTYVLITLSLFWIGMPYTLRDQIQWFTRGGTGRIRALAGGLAGTGAVLFTLGLTLHR